MESLICMQLNLICGQIGQCLSLKAWSEWLTDLFCRENVQNLQNLVDALASRDRFVEHIGHTKTLHQTDVSAPQRFENTNKKSTIFLPQLLHLPQCFLCYSKEVLKISKTLSDEKF